MVAEWRREWRWFVLDRKCVIIHVAGVNILLFWRGGIYSDFQGINGGLEGQRGGTLHVCTKGVAQAPRLTVCGKIYLLRPMKLEVRGILKGSAFRCSKKLID